MAPAYSQRSARAYQRANVEAASPTQLVLMLYDGAIRFLSLAGDRFAAGDIEGRHVNLVKAEKILAHLMTMVDLEAPSDLPGNLVRLYEYMYRRLVEANLRDEPEPAREVAGMLRDMRSAWAAADTAAAPAAA